MMMNMTYLFGVATGCLVTLLSGGMILLWIMRPYLKQAADKARGANQ